MRNSKNGKIFWIGKTKSLILKREKKEVLGLKGEKFEGRKEFKRELEDWKDRNSEIWK